MLHRFVFQKKARLQFDSICDYLGYEFGTKTAEDFVSLRGNTLVIAAFADMRMHPDNVMKAVIGKP